jgi:hypothetical protein
MSRSCNEDKYDPKSHDLKTSEKRHTQPQAICSKPLYKENNLYYHQFIQRFRKSTTDKMASPDAYTAPFMLTKSMHRDVYPAIDPTQTEDLRADSKVIIIFGATSGLGFVS